MAEAQPSIINQLGFKETPYSDATWEVVGEPPKEQVFVPLELNVIRTHKVLADPMFADYGGQVTSDAPKRWHLPAELAQQQASALAQKSQQAEVPPGINMQEEELEEIKRLAFEEGKNAALLEAKAAQEKMIQTLSARLETLLQDMSKQLAERMESIEKSAVQLSLDISHKLIGHAVEINPEYIVQVIKEALKAAGGSTVHVVRVSPEDMEFIEIVGVADKIKDVDGTWKFEKDDTIKSGCVIDTSSGEVDFQVNKAWERIRDGVLKSIR